MKIRLVKEVNESLRTKDDLVWEGEISTPEVSPPIEIIQHKGEVYKFAAKFDGVFIYRQTTSLVVDNG